MKSKQDFLINKH